MFATYTKRLSKHNCANLVSLGDVFVFGCVWLCLVVFVCVVFVVLLVASVLAWMRWLLCGGDGSGEKATSVISKEMFRERNLPDYG